VGVPTPLSTYARNFLNDEVAARRFLDRPVLVWETPTEGFEDELFTTEASEERSVPKSGTPVVFELRKSTSKTNAFAMGITIGRTGNNDIVLEDKSISRFHAYFQQDPKDFCWRLVDAESKNGSWVDGARLSAGKAEVVADQAKLRFGEVEVQFFLPPSFFEFLQKRFIR
jgi:hypothetical protein